MRLVKQKEKKNEQLMGGSVQLQRQLQLLSEFIYTKQRATLHWSLGFLVTTAVIS